MKKTGAIILCISLCVAVAFIFPRVGTTLPTVANDNDCGECHDFTYPDGEDHVTHSAAATCTDCHVDIGDTPSSSKCVVCHDPEDEEGCTIINFHEDTGLDCLSCHPECDGEPTTTTTSIGPPTTEVTGNIYEVFLVGGGGCGGATMNFRSDNVLILECPEGFGTYLPILNFFTATYWTNNFYQGYGALFLLSGVALDPYIVASGIALYSNTVGGVFLTGYLKSSQ